MIIFLGTLALTLCLGINSIYASTAAFIASGIYALWLRHDLFFNALGSAIATVVIMFFAYLLVFSIPTNIETLMQQGWEIYGTPLDWRLAGIPMTEMIWGFAMGFWAGPLYEFLHFKRLNKYRQAKF